MSDAMVVELKRKLASQSGGSGEAVAAANAEFAQRRRVEAERRRVAGDEEIKAEIEAAADPDEGREDGGGGGGGGSSSEVESSDDEEEQATYGLSFASEGAAADGSATVAEADEEDIMALIGD